MWKQLLIESSNCRLFSSDFYGKMKGHYGKYRKVLSEDRAHLGDIGLICLLRLHQDIPYPYDRFCKVGKVNCDTVV